MNLFLNILILLVTITSTFAKVEVISVNMGFFAVNHAKDLEKIINRKESCGCVLLKVQQHNNATYLFFRCKDN